MIRKPRRKDKNMPVGTLKQVKDFLPPPSELVFPQDTVKVTLSLTRESVDFFKKEARKNKTKYQTMIRKLVDQYTKIHLDE